MRNALRWKILVLTVLPLAALAVTAIWIVNQGVSGQVQRTIERDLQGASAILESVLDARARELGVAARVIVRDPKFFSAYAIHVADGDSRERAAMGRAARNFNAITRTDLFEIADPRGRLIASAGGDASDARARAALVGDVLAGRKTAAVLVSSTASHQVAAAPVIVGDRAIGVLLLGSRIGEGLARRLRSLTRSEVTFVSGGLALGSTLAGKDDRSALLQALSRLAARSRSHRASHGLLRVTGSSHEYLTLARPLPGTTPELGQVYVMQRSLDEEASYLREIQSDLRRLGVAAILVAFLAGVFITQRLTSPVRHLVRGAEEMERGNYDFPLDLEARDEIGYLSTRVHEMRARQRDYVRSLQDVMRVKNEFISIASHELRAPIRAIADRRVLMLQESNAPVNDQQRQALEVIGQSLGTLERIAEDATRMAQIQDDRLLLTLGDYDVANLVEQAIDAAIAKAQRRRVQVVRDLDPDLGPVHVDGPRMIEAISNLVSNGIRFTPDGGRVEISARREGDDLRVEVRDNGIGIDPDQQKRLLEGTFGLRDSRHHHSSSTLEFNSSGMGLGLAIVRGIIEEHGGDIRIDSEPGRGSCFVIHVPARPRGYDAVRQAA